ncbi:Transposase DDE domain-containing protein [Puniceibacterium sediminis]|uniref:Transposase DDE domain-containing protein n=1 Tax=Puniceibacterium sediminis TaxID=1608407 RepID=A0A238ZEI4_9RHOB|nr:Transposase DDE domain-containing protein [Puniceibacterium sediminis]
MHIGIDEETLEVRAVGVTTTNVGDAPMLPELLGQIPLDQNIGSVTADGAYDTRKCHDAIAARNAHAVIPPRKNAKPWKPTSAGAMARNEAVNASRYLGRALWQRLSVYHRRSRVETKVPCVKLLGQSLMTRDFDRQVAEIQVRIAVLNRCYTALGIPVTEAVISLSGERGSPPSNRFVQQSRSGGCCISSSSFKISSVILPRTFYFRTPLLSGRNTKQNQQRGKT